MKRGGACRLYNLSDITTATIHYWCHIPLRFISNSPTFQCFVCPVEYPSLREVAEGGAACLEKTVGGASVHDVRERQARSNMNMI